MVPRTPQTPHRNRKLQVTLADPGNADVAQQLAGRFVELGCRRCIVAIAIGYDQLS